jgi:chaperone required for assembly of F1-ATPase
MSEWKARRFWTGATVRQVADRGWEVTLDERPVRTPGKLALALPTMRLAQAIAAEWDAQSEVIDPTTMPLTRAANSAIEKVAVQFDGVVSMLADYGATDLLSYRADQPETLIRMQAEAWDPLIDWSATCLHAPLRITHGVIPVPQDPDALARLRSHLSGLDPFGLMAMHDLVTVPGSLIIGLGVAHGRINGEEAHRLSRIDEAFQASQWGEDEEAMQAAESRRQAILSAERFWHLSRAD